MDNEDEKIIKLFKIISKEKLNIKDNSFSRKATEEEYFKAYLYFKSNCIYYSKFKYYNERTKTYITGKYLNQKYNNWVSSGILEEIYNVSNNTYLESKHPSVFKNISVDTLFVPNRFIPKKKIGRCVYYKSKYGAKINSFTDTLGSPIDLYVDKGSEHDATIAIKRLNIVSQKINVSKYKNSNKFKRIILGDAIYDSKKFKKNIEENDLVTLTHTNIRNIKDPVKLKEKELTNKQKKTLKERHIVENNFAWITQYCPRFYRIFYKSLENFLNELYITATKTILKRI